MRKNSTGLDEAGEFGNLYYNSAIRLISMVWIRARNSALVGLAPLVRVNPRGIHIETTQTDTMSLHTHVGIRCVLEAYSNLLWRLLCPQQLQAYMKALQVRPFCNFCTSVSHQQ